LPFVDLGDLCGKLDHAFRHLTRNLTSAKFKAYTAKKDYSS
jgi:hypothetical protein